MVLLCVLFPVDAAPVNLVNQLKNNPSPYLAMHGEDPVAWQSWGEEVFKLAQKTNKLIFVSSGYFSCHWCHALIPIAFPLHDVTPCNGKAIGMRAWPGN